MTKQNEYKPDYLVSPGEVIEGYLEERYHTDQSFSMGIDNASMDLEIEEKVLKDIVLNAGMITRHIAEKLEKLGPPAHFWMNLERRYQEERQRLSGISPWRKVSDEPPPKDGTRILVKNSDGDFWTTWFSPTTDLNTTYWWDDNGPRNTQVNFHEWMPIPEGR